MNVRTQHPCLCRGCLATARLGPPSHIACDGAEKGKKCGIGISETSGSKALRTKPLTTRWLLKVFRAWRSSRHHTFCHYCACKNLFLPPESGSFEEYVAEYHQPLSVLCSEGTPQQRDMWIASHTMPQEGWMRIMLTEKLHAMSIRQPPGAKELWLRTPLRSMAPIIDSEENRSHLQTQTELLETYHGNHVRPGPDNKYTVFHFIPIVNLISAHERAPGSNGVLVDGFMRNGSHHGDGIGIYTHSGFPDWYVKPGDGYCVLELRAAPYLTRLGHGAGGRYIVKAPQIGTAMGSHCPLVQVVAVWFRPGSVPGFFVV